MNTFDLDDAQLKTVRKALEADSRRSLRCLVDYCDSDRLAFYAGWWITDLWEIERAARAFGFAVDVSCD